MGIGEILVWCLFGLVVGALARFVMPGSDPMGCLATIVLGVLGSIVGGYLGGLLFGGDGEFEPAGFIGALIGAVILLAIYRQFRRPSNVEGD